jgi:hypothetical protein
MTGRRAFGKEKHRLFDRYYAAGSVGVQGAIRRHGACMRIRVGVDSHFGAEREIEINLEGPGDSPSTGMSYVIVIAGPLVARVTPLLLSTLLADTLMPKRKKHVEFVICVANERYDDLQAWKVYRVLPDVKAAEVGCLRVIDESGEDYLYPTDRFAAVDLPRDVRERLLGVPTRYRPGSALLLARN